MKHGGSDLKRRKAGPDGVGSSRLTVVLLCLILVPRLYLLFLHSPAIPRIAHPDTYSHYLYAYRIIDAKDFPRFGQPIADKLHLGPLSYYLAAAGAVVSKDIRVIAGSVEVLFIASVFVLFFTARRFFGPSSALIAASLFAYDKIPWEMATTLTNFCYLPFFFLLYLYFASRVEVGRESRFLPWALFFLGCSMQLHMTVWIFLPALVILHALSRPRASPTQIALGLLLLGLPFAPWLWQELWGDGGEIRALFRFIRLGHFPYSKDVVFRMEEPLSTSLSGYGKVFVFPFLNFWAAHGWAAWTIRAGAVAGLAFLLGGILWPTRLPGKRVNLRDLTFIGLHCLTMMGFMSLVQIWVNILDKSRLPYWYAITPIACMLAGRALALPIDWALKKTSHAQSARLRTVRRVLVGVWCFWIGMTVFSEATWSVRLYRMRNLRTQSEYAYASRMLEPVKRTVEELGQGGAELLLFTLYSSPEYIERDHLFNRSMLAAILKSRELSFRIDPLGEEDQGPILLVARIQAAAFSIIPRPDRIILFHHEEKSPLWLNTFDGANGFPSHAYTWGAAASLDEEPIGEASMVSFVARFDSLSGYRDWKESAAAILEERVDATTIWEDADDDVGLWPPELELLR